MGKFKVWSILIDLHKDGQIRFLHQQHKSLEPVYIMSTIQPGGGGVMLWGTLSCHTFGPLIPINHCWMAHLNLPVFQYCSWPQLKFSRCCLITTSSMIMKYLVIKQNFFICMNMTMNSVFFSSRHSHLIFIAVVEPEIHSIKLNLKNVQGFH